MQQPPFITAVQRTRDIHAEMVYAWLRRQGKPAPLTLIDLICDLGSCEDPNMPVEHANGKPPSVDFVGGYPHRDALIIGDGKEEINAFDFTEQLLAVVGFDVPNALPYVGYEPAAISHSSTVWQSPKPQHVPPAAIWRIDEKRKRIVLATTGVMAV